MAAAEAAATPDRDAMRLTVIGLGEAGRLYAQGAVAAGYVVTGYDPFAPDEPAGVARAATLADAVASADIVLTLTAASLSEQIAAEAAPELRADATYVDCTTASPEVLARVAEVIEAAGPAFADVAILGPVPIRGAATDAIVSGSGRRVATETLRSFGATVEDGGDVAGDASARKLLRSILMKGLGAIITEALAAGRAAGSEQWIRGQIARQLAGDGHAVVERLERGTRLHAVRRAHEMAAVAEYLESLGVAHDMATATQHTHERLAAEQE
ncbi:NAD(P)-dependent oxidoreductase [Microbacterium sp. cf332]|uniref:NAD(P)-dependent oxidoreductase n=1 Tax=Microbacterium sp. cf332 TaxID=1761804 RepID=UPI0008840731|nr:NAD(P)-dependent oxidoreductase [Microbacterium sp. cf332]SDQ64359.1 3-hydroxyisobutyrate dehydrogenase [Microbacterium sp. cf332]